VLPDTPVWSAALRRTQDPPGNLRRQLEGLIVQGVVELIGPIRQEVLSGIKNPATFENVREQLRLFPDLPIVTEDYEEAAAAFNRCQSRGIQGSFVDFLICAVSVRHGLHIFTEDRDFDAYATVLPIHLYRPS